MATLQLSITVPDNRQTDVINTIASALGYDVNSGLTKSQFIQQETRERLRGIYLREKERVATISVIAPVLADINSFDFT